MKKTLPTSMAVICHLLDQGHTQQSLAKVLGVNRSFISHVAHGNRNLTLGHLETLAAHFGMTLPELYMKAVPMEAVAKDLQEGYGLFLKAMRTTEQAKVRLRRRHRAKVTG